MGKNAKIVKIGEFRLSLQYTIISMSLTAYTHITHNYVPNRILQKLVR